MAREGRARGTHAARRHPSGACRELRNPDFLAQRSHADISGGSYLLGFRHLLDLLRHYGNEAPLQRPDEAFAVEARRRTAHLLEIERSLLGLPEAAPALQIMLPVTTPIALEIAYDLIPLFEPDAKGRSRALDELVPAVRAALQAQFGFSFPGISIHGNQSDMASGSALVLIDEIPEEMLRMDPGNVLRTPRWNGCRHWESPHKPGVTRKAEATAHASRVPTVTLPWRPASLAWMLPSTSCTAYIRSCSAMRPPSWTSMSYAVW